MADKYAYNTYALKNTSRHPDNKDWLERMFGQPGTPIVSDRRMPKIAPGKGDRLDSGKGDNLNAVLRKLLKK